MSHGKEIQLWKGHEVQAEVWKTGDRLTSETGEISAQTSFFVPNGQTQNTPFPHVFCPQMIHWSMLMIMILYPNDNDQHPICQLGSDDGMSEYGDDRGSEDLSLWQVGAHPYCHFKCMIKGENRHKAFSHLFRNCKTRLLPSTKGRHRPVQRLLNNLLHASSNILGKR